VKDSGFGNTARAAAHVGIVLVAVALFFWSFGAFLNPFLLFWVVVGLMLPFRGTPQFTAVGAVAALLTLLWVLDTTGFLLAPFALALVLAYILDPVVDRLEHRMSRSIAILLLTLPAVGALAVLGFIGIPAMVGQAAELIERLPQALDRAAGLAEGWDAWLRRLDLPLIDEAVLVDQIRGVDGQAILQVVRERFEEILSGTWSGVLGLGRGLGTALTLLGYAVLTPVLTFYLLRDWDGLRVRVLDLIPPGRRQAVVAFAEEYDRDLSAYLRGQITVAAIVGSLTAVGLLVVGFPYAFFLGTIVAVFGLIPYAGLLMSLIPAVLIALLSGNIGLGLAKVGGVFVVAQSLEAAVISPRIVGESVGLHPVWIVLALSVGGFFLGFLGLLIGVPLAVGLKLLLTRGVAHYRSSQVYLGSDSGTGTAAD